MRPNLFFYRISGALSPGDSITAIALPPVVPSTTGSLSEPVKALRILAAISVPITPCLRGSGRRQA
ncbi:hypothetical protein GCM10009605_11300 [Nocardiopsis composta]